MKSWQTFLEFYIILELLLIINDILIIILIIIIVIKYDNYIKLIKLIKLILYNILIDQQFSIPDRTHNTCRGCQVHEKEQSPYPGSHIVLSAPSGRSGYTKSVNGMATVKQH